MYLNNVTLTGFLGGDADTRTTKNDTNFTAFSLATKTPGRIARLANGIREPNGIAPLFLAG